MDAWLGVRDLRYCDHDNLLLQRLEKEIIHEVGHTFGLYHCRHFECVMRSSTYVEEIDLKRETFCSSCSSLLKTLLAKAGESENPDEKFKRRSYSIGETW